jgi:mannose-6-phosphate isomerase-like protein (cupin superfamily)
VSSKLFVNKGWGYEEVLTNTELYCAKILHLNKDKKLSWHYHNIKDETFYVENGEVDLFYGDSDDINEAKTLRLKSGDSFHVPVGLRHRLYGVQNSRVFEFSTQHFDHDSVRVIRGD